MQDEVNAYFNKATDYMDEAIDRLQRELIKIQTGKASPSMLSGIMVEYYGNPTPLNQVANVSASDSKTISIQPWEKTMLAPIEQAIFAANMGMTPMNNGETILLNIPPLTEERRKDLAKKAKALGEEARVSLRHARHKVMDFIKNAVKDGYPEDMGKRQEDKLQKIIDNYNEKVGNLVEAKSKDIMTV